MTHVKVLKECIGTQVVIEKQAGGKSGNIRLRESLGWNESLYESVKAALIRDGSIEPGQGRGGSVKLVGFV